MQKRAPTLGNIFVIILFALSCFGLLLFLWESFGGPLPLKPKGYRFNVSFARTLVLSEQSDVRISGVDVGHVVALKLNKGGTTDATLEIDSKYAPIPASTHAILRVKTLLGETYVQLIPHGPIKPSIPDNGHLANANVEPTVTLDDILAALDKPTREYFRVWQQSVAVGINGRGEQINADFAVLEPFVEHTNKLLRILASQEGALRQVVKNTGVVFSALASRDHQLESMIVHGERTFHAAAEASEAFAQAFRELPPFEKSSEKALQETDKFAAVANPYFEEFRETERQLAALLNAAKPFTPQFNSFLTSLGPLTAAAKVGLPQTKTTLDLTVPILENLTPVLHNFDPFLQFTGEYVPEVQAFFANVTAAAQSSLGNGDIEGVGGQKGPKVHYLSTMSVLSPESLSVYQSKVETSRINAYPLPGTYRQLANGLPSFEAVKCSGGAPSVSASPGEKPSKALQEQIEQLIAFKVANKPGSPNDVAAPPCRQQGPFTFNGKTSQFPQAVFSGK
jgi:phospholipid/cholesterol/gamma-HCH transport system substrate-binding protein